MESSLVRELLLARVQVAHSWVAMARIAVGAVLTDAAEIVAISTAMLQEIDAAVTVQSALNAMALKATFVPMDINPAHHKLSMTQLEVLTWISEVALRPGFEALRDPLAMVQLVFHTVCSTQGYCKLMALHRWADMPERMRDGFVKTMLRDISLTPANVGTVTFIDHHVANSFPRELALISLMGLAAESSHAFPAADTVQYEGENQTVSRLIQEFERDHCLGRKLRSDRKPSDDVLKKVIKMRTGGTLSPINLKECCSVKSFLRKQAGKGLDGKNDMSQMPTLTWAPNGMKPVPAPAEGLGPVHSANGAFLYNW